MASPDAPRVSEWRRLSNALRVSMCGLQQAFRAEAAFRIEVVLALILIPVALGSSQPTLAKAMLVASVFLVLICELLNSAIEATVDRISLERHPLAKRAKDIGSATVLLGLINFLAVWLLIFLF